MLGKFSEVLGTRIKGELARTIETSCPAVITNVSEYESMQVVDVQPIAQYETEDKTVIQFPLIYRCPVVLEGTSDGIFSFPLKVGDLVKLDFSKYSLQELIGGISNDPYLPQGRKVFGQSDAFVSACINKAGDTVKPSATDAQWKFKNSIITLKSDGDIVITNGSATATLKIDGEIDLNGCTITATGNVITAAGTDLDAFKLAYNTHTHNETGSVTLAPNP